MDKQFISAFLSGVMLAIGITMLAYLVFVIIDPACNYNGFVEEFLDTPKQIGGK